MDEDIPQEDSNDLIPSVMDQGLSEAIDVFTGLPLPHPIKKRFFKSVGRLWTACVDIGVAYFESKSGSIHAQNKNREKIISAVGDNIAVQIKVAPEYAQMASRKYAEKIIGERLNLDAITKGAIEHLQEKCPTLNKDETQQHGEDQDISDDWLNTFEREVSQKS